MALSINGFPVNIGTSTFIVKPYYVKDGVKTYGNFYTVVFTNGMLVSQMRGLRGIFMEKKKNFYIKPEITVIQIDKDNIITTTSGYVFKMEGYGDELYWYKSFIQLFFYAQINSARLEHRA